MTAGPVDREYGQLWLQELGRPCRELSRVERESLRVEDATARERYGLARTPLREVA